MLLFFQRNFLEENWKLSMIVDGLLIGSLASNFDSFKYGGDRSKVNTDFQTKHTLLRGPIKVTLIIAPTNVNYFKATESFL